MSVRAATLAVGTEVTDGQIIDRNSAWISQKLVHSGIDVIEHRAVADDRQNIRQALSELASRVDLLFVTGGLGPTSDDFTRDLIAEVFCSPLKFDEHSWRQVQEKLSSRGITAREIQKQQCYFPDSAQILENPLGTANGFLVAAEHPAQSGRMIKVIALPGPPAEIASVWEKSLESELSALVPENQRETLTIFRCLGRGESEIAEMTEILLQGTNMRVGYRAHLPYVEVKLWRRAADLASQTTIERVQQKLKEWIVNQDSEDASEALLADLQKGHRIQIFDFATSGLLQERLALQIKALKLSESSLDLQIHTHFSSPQTQQANIEQTLQRIHEPQSQLESWVAIIPRPETENWLIYFRKPNGQVREVEVKPNFNLKIHTERAKRFITEKTLLLFSGE